MINSRALIITLIVFAAFVSLVVQLFSVQIGSHEKYSARATKQQNRVFPIRAERGIIYDRNGEILAYTKDDVSLYADARMLRSNSKKRQRLANELAKVFNTKPSKYINLIKRAKRNVCLEKKIPKEKSLLLTSLVIDGFYKTEDYTRIYPYSNITSHILGYVDDDCNGRAGFEKLYDSELNGVDGELYVENDAVGRSVSIDYDNSIPAISGNSFNLTINKVYQKILVNELKEGIINYKGKSAIGIIVNPKTGEILALANVPDYNPHQYFKVSNFVRRNRALTDTYEPGSTLKSIVMALLLEEGIVSEKNVINTENGKYKIKGALIRDTHKFEKLTVQEVLEQSSNIGMVKLSDKIGERDFYKGLRDFGFGNSTSIDLMGESKGMLKKPDYYSGISKAFMSHGYEISVTPIQMIMAYSALINGGRLLQPYILKSIFDQNGEIEEEFEPTKIRDVISEETSNRIRNIMLGVVENGTGSKAQQDNVYVGGKTGTAQKLVNGKYSRRLYNSSFIGFFPADDPEIICFVLVDSPEIGRYGGQVAAPIFSNITKKIMETDFSIERNKNKIERESIIQNFVASVEEYDVDDDLISFANVSDEAEKNERPEKIVRSTMPNLRNKSIREAISILSALNIEYSINGSGRVNKQSINKGTPVANGMTCILTCSNNIQKAYN
jgi:cell division protein FtsI/penicillin-binding protein 2